jgi:uncharacterized protein YhbP (UPF0306 family)
MILCNYLTANIKSIVNIRLYICERYEDLFSPVIDEVNPSINYSYYIWDEKNKILYLLKNDYTVGHMLAFLENDNVNQDKDDETSFIITSNNHPRIYKLSFFFGGAKL